MPRPSSPPSLDTILRDVSRSFYLTLRAVPRPVRSQLGLAYLFCRAADTVADTRLLPVETRLEHLLAFRAQFEAEVPKSGVVERIAAEVGAPQAVPAERELLERLAECFEVYNGFEDRDRTLVRRLVTTLTRGMETDLTRFPPEESGRVVSLDTDEELDLYCYHVAGCVGEFWTDLCRAHLPALRAWRPERMRYLGVRFGKGLQMTNILRDIDADLRIGRVYLPASRLEPIGWSAERWSAATDRSAVRSVVHDLLGVTLDHYAAGWEYTLEIPRRLPTLRLACAWPLLIGLRTLGLLAGAEDPCAPGVVLKVSRAEVRRILRGSMARVWSNRALDASYRALESAVRSALQRADGPRAGGMRSAVSPPREPTGSKGKA